MDDDDDRNASDEAWVRATLAGEPEAFGRLYDRYAPLVRAVCYDGTGGDLAQAQDLCQEAFLRAYRNLASLKRPEQFAGWLIGIARHVCREWRRSAGRRRKHLTRLGDVARVEGEPGTGDDEPAAADEDLARLRAAIASLPQSEREALNLFYLMERPASEAAEALGLSRSGFYRCLDRAKQRLGRLLGIDRSRGGVAP